MFIVTTDDTGVILTLRLGNRAQYDAQRVDNPDLQFLEDRDVTGLYQTNDVMQSPQSFRLVAGIGLIRTN